MMQQTKRQLYFNIPFSAKLSQTYSASGIFTLFAEINSCQMMAGLMVGGAIATPFGACICHRIHVPIVIPMVGLVIIFLSIKTLFISHNLPG